MEIIMIKIYYSLIPLVIILFFLYFIFREIFRNIKSYIDNAFERTLPPEPNLNLEENSTTTFRAPEKNLPDIFTLERKLESNKNESSVNSPDIPSQGDSVSGILITATTNSGDNN